MHYCAAKLPKAFALATIVLLLFQSAHFGMGSSAENLPTKGTFISVYHKDTWGVGRFLFFIVEPSLHAKLSPFEGKRISLEVTKGSQPENPGPAVMEEIGDIQTLPDPPLSVELATRPKAIATNVPFQVICTLQNSGNRPLPVSGRDVTVRLARELKNESEPDAPDFLIPSYKRGQLQTSSEPFGMYSSLVTDSGGQYEMLSHGDHLIIPANDHFPVVLMFSNGLPVGKYELQLSARAQLDKEQLEATDKWLAIEVANELHEAIHLKHDYGVLRRSVSLEEGAYSATISIAAPEEAQQRIAQSSEFGKAVFAGQLRAFTKTGEPVRLRVHAQEPSTTWQLTPVPPTGVNIAVGFRKATNFPSQAIYTLFIDLLMGDGVESFCLANEYDDKNMPLLPPFGKEAGGIRLRIRPLAASFKEDQTPVFYLQAENRSGKPVCWRQASGHLSSALRLAIDGKTLDLKDTYLDCIQGWAAEWTVNNPQEWEIEIPISIWKPLKGAHRICYTLKAQRGHYLNANNIEVPLLSNDLTSNVAEFKVE